ncbi:MAG: MBL fold metallo-hydrolase [Acidobacteriota bacterium]
MKSDRHKAGSPAKSGLKTSRLGENLFWIQDSCNVFLVKRGRAALMIDCGTYTPALQLEQFDVDRVEQVLLTHFHRDQCSAADEWSRRGAKLIVPFAEKRFFEESDLLRASYDVFDNYLSYYPYFGSLNDIRPDLCAHDYERLEWQGLTFHVVPLPGHTFGSVGYLFELNGQRLLACGDLMSQPGKIANYYSLQWKYMDFQGHVNELESLATLASLGVDFILPGHGIPFTYTESAVNHLREPLERLYELFYARPVPGYQPIFRHISDHVVEVTNSLANTYLVLDDGGHALAIDCGYTSAAPICMNPHRYIDHLTPSLETELGIRQVEWFLFSHYHDDHLAGYPALRSRYGTRILSSPELRDVVEHPERYNMPCLLPQGLPIDRIVERGQAFEWRGTSFFLEQHPGQTLYHHLIWFHIDGKKFLVIGDNISGLCFREARDFIYSFIPKNRTPVSSYRDMPDQLLEHSPDVVLTGHGGAVDFDRSKVLRWRNWMDEWQGTWNQILDQSIPDRGMDPQWIEFYPFKVRVRPGETVSFEVRITNHDRNAKPCLLRFRSVPGVRLDPVRVSLEVAAGGLTRVGLKAAFPKRFTSHSLSILADVSWDNCPLGEIAEAIAYW